MEYAPLSQARRSFFALFESQCICQPMYRLIAKLGCMLLIGGILLLGGCPRKATLRKGSRGLVTASAEELIHQLASPSYSALRVRFQATYEGERRQTFLLRLSAMGDSLLWLSAGFMGIEGMRMLWRPDSLFVLSRLTREVYVGPVDSLRALLPAVGPSDLVALLIGKWPPTFQGGKWLWKPETHQLVGKIAQYQAQATLSQDIPLRITDWHLQEAAGQTFHLRYEWGASAQNSLPTQISLRLPDDTHLLLIPKQTEFNPTDVAMPFSIPDGYSIKPLSAFSW
jgi:hypothetical protein